METLTDAGREWAEANAAESITARIALFGRDSGWPAGHVTSAIKTCNEAATPAKPDLAAEVADALTPERLQHWTCKP